MNYCPECGSVLSTRMAGGKVRPACPKCHFVHFSDPKLATAVIIGWEGKVLLGKRIMHPAAGKWSFPSGFVDRGEPVEEAAIREVLEETGLEVRLDRLIGLISERDNPVVLAVYAGTIAGGTLQAGDDLGELHFYAPDALPPLAFEHDAEIIHQWANGSARGGVAPDSPRE